jgi:hypothetical protein
MNERSFINLHRKKSRVKGVIDPNLFKKESKEKVAENSSARHGSPKSVTLTRPRLPTRHFRI